MDQLHPGLFESEFLTGEAEEPAGGGYGGRRCGAHAHTHAHGHGMPLTEEQEMEYAMELLSVANEAELEQFLGGFFSKNPIGKALGGVLKKVAKTALPMVGGALGTLVGGPAGTALGTQLGSFGAKALGLELEGLSEEDSELEVAQRIVRLAADAAQNAAQAPPGAPAQQVARAALAAAAARHAPGLLSGGGGAGAPAAAGGQAPHAGHAHHGQWYRHGNRIVLVGA